MATGSWLAWLVALAMLSSGAVRAQTPPHQELAGTARRPPALQPAMAEASELSVPFRTGSAELTPTATRALDTLGHLSGASATLRVVGFADTPGSGDAGRDLAHRRAEAVARYLATLGVARVEVAALARAAPYPRRAKVSEENR